MRRADVRRNSGGRVLLICGFGTGDADEMERTYGRLVEEAREAVLEAAREAESVTSVRLALTSPKVIGRLYRERGIKLPDVRSALEDILGGAACDAAVGGALGDAAGEIEEIRILTVQVVGGTEFEKLKAIADTYSGQVRISLDSPLLAGPKIDFVADMLVEEAASFKEEVIVYVGHGTHGRDPRGPAAYRKLQELIHDRGNGNTFIGELQTGIEPVIRELSEKAFRRIRLCSLMMVSGHHWFEDVAGENDGSWKNVLTRAGYTLFRSAVNSFVSPRRCSYRLFITCFYSVITVVKQPIREYNESIQRLDRWCTK